MKTLDRCSASEAILAPTCEREGNAVTQQPQSGPRPLKVRLPYVSEAGFPCGSHFREWGGWISLQQPADHSCFRQPNAKDKRFLREPVGGTNVWTAAGLARLAGHGASLLPAADQLSFQAGEKRIIFPSSSQHPNLCRPTSADSHIPPGSHLARGVSTSGAEFRGK